MKIGELKNIISKLDDNVEVEIIMESGFSSISSNDIGVYFDSKSNKLIIEGEEVEFE